MSSSLKTRPVFVHSKLTFGGDQVGHKHVCRSTAPKKYKNMLTDAVNDSETFAVYYVKTITDNVHIVFIILFFQH